MIREGRKTGTPWGRQGRRGIRLTRPGWGMLALVVLFYAAAVTSQSTLLLLLIGILIGCLGTNLLMALSAVASLRVEPPVIAHLAEGGRLSDPWRVVNEGTRTAGLIRLDSGAGRLLRVALLQPGERRTMLPELAFERRGVYRIGECLLVCAWPFRLVEARRRLDIAGEIVVHPAIFPAPIAQAAAFDAVVGGRFHGRSTSSGGSYFAGIRPIQPGDPFKQIHWRSSARGRGLQVKTYEEELSGRISFVMDGGHDGDAKAFDDCIRATASLIFAALEAGHHVEWIDVASIQPVVVPPYSDGEDLLDHLARLTLRPGVPEAEDLLAAVGRVSSRSSLCFVLSRATDSVSRVVGELRRRGRRVTVCVGSTEEMAWPEGVETLRFLPREILEVP